MKPATPFLTICLLAAATPAFGALTEEACQQLYEQGAQKGQAGNCAEATPIFRDTVTQCPWLSRAHYDLGLCHHISGDTAQAVDAWKQAVALAPQDAGYRETLAYGYVGQRSWPEALAQLESLWDLDEAKAITVAQAVVMARAMPIAEQQPDGWTFGRKLQNKELTPLLIEADRRLTAGQPGDIVQQLQQAAKDNPDEPMVVMMLVKAYQVQKDYAGAVQALQTALERQPKDPWLLLMVGWCQYLSERYDEAVATWQRLQPIDEVAYGTCAKLVREVNVHVYRKFDADRFQKQPTSEP